MLIKPNHPGLRLLALLRLRIAQLERKEEKRLAKLYGRTQSMIEQRLQKLNTRELMKMLEWSRQPSGDFYLAYDMETIKACGGYSDYDEKSQLALLEGYAVRKVLATREHVPNKLESKRNRRKLATMHHGKRKRKKSK